MENRIGETIRILRTNFNLSQEALAETLNVSRQAVSNWENGKTQPDADTLIQLSTIFQVSIDEIVNYGGSKGILTKNQRGMVVCLVSIIISVTHFVLALLGNANIIGVIASVMLASFIAIIMFFAFESSIKSNDFSMIAGYKKSDSSNYPRFVKQLRTMSLLVGINALILNILYAPIYFADISLHMKISMVYLFVFIAGLVITIITVNHKYKATK